MTNIITLTDVRSRRVAAHLSQQELAARAHCSLSAVRLFERGYAPADSETLARIGRVLDELEQPGDPYDGPEAA